MLHLRFVLYRLYYFKFYFTVLIMNKINCVNWVVNNENRLIQLINKLISYVVSSTCKELKKIVGRYISLLDVTFHCWYTICM